MGGLDSDEGDADWVVDAHQGGDGYFYYQHHLSAAHRPVSAAPRVQHGDGWLYYPRNGGGDGGGGDGENRQSGDSAGYDVGGGGGGGGGGGEGHDDGVESDASGIFDDDYADDDNVDVEFKHDERGYYHPPHHHSGRPS